MKLNMLMSTYYGGSWLGDGDTDPQRRPVWPVRPTKLRDAEWFRGMWGGVRALCALDRLDLDLAGPDGRSVRCGAELDEALFRRSPHGLVR